MVYRLSYLKNRNRGTDMENKQMLGCQGGRRGGQDELRDWDFHTNTLLILCIKIGN